MVTVEERPAASIRLSTQMGDLVRLGGHVEFAARFELTVDPEVGDGLPDLAQVLAPQPFEVVVLIAEAIQAVGAAVRQTCRAETAVAPGRRQASDSASIRTTSRSASACLASSAVHRPLYPPPTTTRLVEVSCRNVGRSDGRAAESSQNGVLLAPASAAAIWFMAADALTFSLSRAGRAPQTSSAPVDQDAHPVTEGACSAGTPTLGRPSETDRVGGAVRACQASPARVCRTELTGASLTKWCGAA